MTQEAAWYRWEARRERGGDEGALRLADWFSAEAAVLRRVDELGIIASM